MDILTTDGVLYSSQPYCGYKSMQSYRQSVNSRKISLLISLLLAARCCQKVEKENSAANWFFHVLHTNDCEGRNKRWTLWQQQPNRHRERDSRKKQILSLNLTTDHRRRMKTQTPKQDWQIVGLGFCTPAEVLSLHQIQFGKSKPVFRNCQVAWFDSWRWLPYFDDEDTVICHTCTSKERKESLQPSWPKSTQTGTICFPQHEISQWHREAVERSITLHLTTKDVGEHISSVHEQDKANNRTAVMKMLSNIRFLARQDITNVGTDNEIILTSHMFNLRTEDNPALATWLVKKTNKYTPGQMQNEIYGERNCTRGSQRCRSFPTL